MIEPYKKNAVLYTRVSTKEQKDFGNSLSTQKSRLHLFCDLKSINIHKYFEEDYSAKNFDRPVFKELMTYCKANKDKIDYLLIYKWDRFSRNTAEALHIINLFKQLGIEVNCTDQWIDHEDPNQLIFLLMNLGIPETDNRIRTNRTKEGIRTNLKEGRWIHAQPKGYIPGRDEAGKVLMRPDPEIAPLIANLFEDFALGIYSQNEIRKTPKYASLNLSKSGISRILNQIAYTGQIIVPAYKDEPEIIVDALHEAIVSKETYYKVQNVLSKKKTIKSKPSKHKPELPLRGLLKCNQCGGNLTGSGSKSKTGKIYHYYHCDSGKGCKERFRADLAHLRLHELLSKLEPKEEACELFELILKDKFAHSDSSNKNLVKSNQNKIVKFEKRQSILMDKFLDNDIDQISYAKKDRELKESINSLKEEISQLRCYEKDMQRFMQFGVNVLKNLGNYFEKASVKSKLKLLSSIFKEKLIFQEDHYRTPNFNEGIKLIYLSINELQDKSNKKRRQSFDYLPLGTPGGT